MRMFLYFSLVLALAFPWFLHVSYAEASNSSPLEEIIFAVREPGKDMNQFGHWYVNFGHFSEHPKQMAYGAKGQLCRLHLKTGKLTVLLNDAEGAVRDPNVSYDGRKILFSYRKGGSDFYHLYEINCDGTGLRQLTEGPYDDIEPVYLPDGGIMFCSSRANRFVNCWISQVATLHRCDANGKNIRLISPNVEHDNTPWVLPDGRVLYQRWEYVDRNQVSYHHLWTTNPDGTSQMVYFGNMNPGGVFIGAKPIPNSKKIVMINSPGHGRLEHAGYVSIVTPEFGPDKREAEQRITKRASYRDPYPLSENDFLVAEGSKILRMDGKGASKTLYTLPASAAGVWVHEPRPLRSRKREPVIPSKVDLTKSTGTLALVDIYRGRNMQGVKRGEIKKLLVLESLPKPINYTGGMDPLTYGGSFTLSRVLGTVPVEKDGSAHLELPANRAFFFVALDENDLSVKRMQSFLSVAPGEHTICIGCHEERTQAVPRVPMTLAVRRPPSQIASIKETPSASGVFDYPRDIQPIWDRHCLDCHDVDKRQGGVLMTGDQGPVYTHSYFELSRRLQMADGRNVMRSSYAPRTLGSAASPLLKMVDGRHHDVKLTPEELRKVKLWIDASAVFPGTYAALGSGMIGGYRSYKIRSGQHVDRSDTKWPSVQAAAEVLDRRCVSCHRGDMRLPRSPSDTLGLNVWALSYPRGKPSYRWTPPWVVTTNPQYAGLKAIDGNVPKQMDADGEWASRGEKNPWIQLNWPAPVRLTSITLYDRANATDNAREALVSFSDGSEVVVRDIPKDAAGRQVTFPERKVTSLKLQVTDGAGLNVGLAELVATTVDGKNVAPKATVSVSSSYYGSEAAYTKNVGSDAWLRRFADPRLRFSRHIEYNLSRPEKSLQLLAPLSKKAGGYGLCGDIFADTSDADYQKLLAAIRDSKEHLEKITRFNMPNFRPNEAYIYEMKRYGALPATYKPGDPIDVYQTDQRYWKSLWWKPEQKSRR